MTTTSELGPVAGTSSRARARLAWMAAVPLAALLLLTGSASAPAQESAATTATYVTGAPDPAAAATVAWASRAHLGVACPASEGAPGIGGGCIALTPGASHVAIAIDDVSGRRVGGTTVFVDAHGAEVGDAQSFCHRHESDVPAAAVGVVVAVDSTIVRCGPTTGGIGTAGSISVR